jgi:hypothetical protein
MKSQGEIIAVGGDWRGWLLYTRSQAEVALRKNVLRIALLPTAIGDREKDIDDFYKLAEQLGLKGDHLALFHDPADKDIPSWFAKQDILVIPGGREEAAKAVWQEEGVEDALRHFYAKGGIILASEEGSGLFFQASLDRHGSLFSGYSFLPYSLCLNQTHYEDKYRRLIEEGVVFAGYMINRREGLHFRGTSLWRALSLDVFLEVSHLSSDGQETRLGTTVVEKL